MTGYILSRYDSAPFISPKGTLTRGCGATPVHRCTNSSCKRQRGLALDFCGTEGTSSKNPILKYGSASLRVYDAFMLQCPAPERPLAVSCSSASCWPSSHHAVSVPLFDHPLFVTPSYQTPDIYGHFHLRHLHLQLSTCSAEHRVLSNFSLYLLRRLHVLCRNSLAQPEHRWFDL